MRCADDIVLVCGGIEELQNIVNRVHEAIIIAKSSWNAAANGCNCTLSSLQRPS